MVVVLVTDISPIAMSILFIEILAIVFFDNLCVLLANTKIVKHEPQCLLPFYL